MRALEWFRNHVAGGKREVLALEAGERGLDQHSNRGLQTFEPLRAFFFLRDVEAAQLDFARALAGAEVAAAVADKIESSDSFRDSSRLIDVGRHLHDAVANANILGAGGAGSEKNLRRGRVRILFEKMMLGRPYVVV